MMIIPGGWAWAGERSKENKQNDCSWTSFTLFGYCLFYLEILMGICCALEEYSWKIMKVYKKSSPEKSYSESFLD